MRLVASFQLHENYVPCDYRVAIQAHFKRALSTYDPDLFSHLYSSNVSKDFTFSVHLNEPIFKGEIIELKDSALIVTYSMYDRILFITLYNALLKSRFVEFPIQNGNFIRLVSLTTQADAIVSESKIRVRMLSPALARKHNRDTNKDVYLDYTNVEFESVMVNSIKSQVLKSLGEEFICDVRFIPINPKKTVVKTRGEKLNANIGTYELHGSPIVLDYLLQAGLGGKKSQGFGLMEMIG